MYPPPRVLQWWRYTQYMLVWAESNQPVNPWQPKQIFFSVLTKFPCFPASRTTVDTKLSPPLVHHHRHRHHHGYIYYYVRVIIHTTTSYRLFFPRSFSRSLFFLRQLKDTFFTGKINHHRLYCAPRIHSQAYKQQYRSSTANRRYNVITCYIIYTYLVTRTALVPIYNIYIPTVLF